MVRAIRHVALALGLACTLLAPLPALADETDGIESAATPVEVPEDSDFSPLVEQLRDHTHSVDERFVSILTELYTLESILDRENEVVEPVEKKEEEPSEVELLQHIDETLSDMAEEPEQVKREPEEPIRAARISLAAYANVSPTNQYSQYAMGYLPRVGWEEHYAYLQDGQQSYIFVWGDLEKVDSTTIAGEGCDWVRWYWASQSQGYLVESGKSDVTITTGSHVVMSDLDGMPLLDPQADSLRKEVGFYALVAAVLFSLASVWTFTLRLRGTVSM